LRHGLFNFYNENGFILTKSIYFLDKLNGYKEDYADSNKLISVENYINGFKQHESKYFYPSGNLFKKGNFIDDVKDGLWFEYFDSGLLSKKTNFSKGKLNGDYIDYYNDGRVEEKGQYLNDQKVGVWKIYFYYKDDVFESVGTFKNGIKSDDWQTYKLKSLDN